MIDEKIKSTVTLVFEDVKAECKRSFTKKNLHPEEKKEDILAQRLEDIVFDYGKHIAEGAFQQEYQKTNPQLSFLFAQVSNAVIEKTFHHGSCHSQAAYALIELAKKSIFSASLMWSDTDNPLTEHYYLIVLDETAETYKTLKNPSLDNMIAVQNSSTRLPEGSLFFDSWSDELCDCKDIPEKNECTKAIKETNQHFFKPFSILFKDSITIFENIILCLNEYEAYLKKTDLIEEDIPQETKQLFSDGDAIFQQEIELLFNRKQCIQKLKMTIATYKKEFQDQLDLLKKEKDTHDRYKAKTDALENVTASFFKQKLPATWKEYPPEKLTGDHAGHKIKFFTLKHETPKEVVDSFVTHLSQEGFSTKLTQAKDKPSILVDLTKSNTI